MNQNIISLEYMAGLVDGEGYIGLTKHANPLHRLGYNFTPTLTISMRNNDEVLQNAAKIYGGFFRKQYVRPDRADKPISIWILTHRKMLRFLKDIFPHVHVKKRQIELMIKYFEEAYPREKGQNGRFLGDSFLEKKIWYYNEMKKLNICGKGREAKLITNLRPAKPTWLPRITKEQFQKLYCEQGLMDYEIAKIVGLKTKTIQRYREMYRIKGHPKTFIAQKLFKPLITQNELAKLYCEDKLTDKQIGKKIRVHPATVFAYRKKYGIKGRDAKFKKHRIMVVS